LARLLVINKKNFDLNSVRLEFAPQRFAEDVLKIYETCGCHFLNAEKIKFIDFMKNRRSFKFCNPQIGRQELLNFYIW
jgi:hypothetical protein